MWGHGPWNVESSSRCREILAAALYAGAAFAQTAKPPPALISEPAKKTTGKPDPNRPLWLRYPAVSPDGKRIAFTYGGQIWVVPATGGRAHPADQQPLLQLPADLVAGRHPDRLRLQPQRQL